LARPEYNFGNNFLVDRKLKILVEGIKKFGGGPGNMDPEKQK